MSTSEMNVTCMEIEEDAVPTATEKRNTSEHQRSTYPLRLPRTTRKVADQLADHEGVSLNQFIVQALVEKITRLERSLSDAEIRLGSVRDLENVEVR